jgi:hypothetical protein
MRTGGAKKRRATNEADHLIARGFDGLYHPDPVMECGCFVSDLYPCGERPKECRPGHQREVNGVLGIFK